jgi:hypothetical protein
MGKMQSEFTKEELEQALLDVIDTFGEMEGVTYTRHITNTKSKEIAEYFEAKADILWGQRRDAEKRQRNG